MKYPATSPRERFGLGMARRDRRACPQRPVRSEQRSQTAQSSLAIRVAPLFHLSGVARRLSPHCGTGMRTPRALERRKMGSNATWLGIFNRLLSVDPVQKTKWLSRGTATLLPASRGPGRFTGIRLVNFLDNAAPYQAHRGLRRATLPSFHRREQRHREIRRTRRKRCSC